MNPLILFLSVLINVTLFLGYLFVMFVVPIAAIALALYAVGRGSMWLVRRLRHSESDGAGGRG